MADCEPKIGDQKPGKSGAAVRVSGLEPERAVSSDLWRFDVVAAGIAKSAMPLNGNRQAIAAVWSKTAPQQSNA